MNRKRNQPSGGYASFFIWISVSTLIIVLDQLTKWAIIKWVPYLERVPVNSFINITHLWRKVL